MWPLVVVLASWLSFAGAQFSVPPVEIHAIQPKGLKVAIPNVPGIKLFGFHAKVNEQVNDKEEGTISGDILQPNNDRWIFEDSTVTLKEGDIINYWVFVQYENFGFRLDNQEFRVKELVSSNVEWSSVPSVNSGSSNRVTPTDCKKSKTTMNGGLKPCKGQVIFEDNFKSHAIAPNNWVIESRLPSDQQENEFSSYQKSSVSIVGEEVNITPKLQESLPGFDSERVETGFLDLRDSCTGSTDEECFIEVQGASIIHPVVSGKISTKNLFSFKYGKIEIRAKFPKGDWLYPELYLKPLNSKYGTEKYSSGVIRIAFIRGNQNLNVNNNNLGNTLLSGGLVLCSNEPCRSRTMVNKTSQNPWSDAYHVYGLIWEENKITLEVDNQPYGTIIPPREGFAGYVTDCPEILKPSNRWKTGGIIAPFDDEFYISLGVGVGGYCDFPNDVGEKPWRNSETKARKLFWKKRSSWYNSNWNDMTKVLRIDSVKVTAL